MKIIFKNNKICVFQSALFQTNSAVINTPDCIIVVDPTWLPDEVEYIKKHTEGLQYPTLKPLYLLFTHSDYDHIIGYNAFPDAITIASKAFVENPEKAHLVQQILDFDDEYYIERNYKIEYPSVSHVVHEDGQVLNIGDTILTFYLAPGHNSDGIFTIVDGILIAGDYLCDVEFPYIYHSSFDYENALNKVDKILQSFDIQLLISGHGNITADKKDILKRQKNALEYIQILRGCIKNGIEFNFNEYSIKKNYRFPKIMKSYHDGNIELIRKESLQ